MAKSMFIFILLILCTNMMMAGESTMQTLQATATIMKTQEGTDNFLVIYYQNGQEIARYVRNVKVGDVFTFGLTYDANVGPIKMKVYEQDYTPLNGDDYLGTMDITWKSGTANTLLIDNKAENAKYLFHIELFSLEALKNKLVELEKQANIYKNSFINSEKQADKITRRLAEMKERLMEIETANAQLVEQLENARKSLDELYKLIEKAKILHEEDQRKIRAYEAYFNDELRPVKEPR